MEARTFNFNNTPITFEFASDDNLMINATEMAKVFNKDVFDFLRMNTTKNYIEAFSQTVNSRFGDEFSPNGKLIKVVKGGEHNGTWMERSVALKFAAWLDPDFEVWVYKTIDALIFGEFYELKEKIRAAADRKARIEFLRNQLKNDPNVDKRVSELIELESKDKKENPSRYAALNRQLSEMKTQLIIKFEEESKSE
ncbi:KilA-N domain-containing protein [Macellibacteroides fermentans]|uniref:KilA-N domain-containing protein n=1 Tax=Macellibacteroides fermentans TaxID=879969 RepID=UPI00406D0539